MSNSTDNDSMQDEPSTPRSIDNVQVNVVDAESVPQAGSYQPTPPGKGVKQSKKDKSKTDTSSSDITKVVKVIKRRKRASQRCDAKLYFVLGRPLKIIGPDLCRKDDFKQRLCDIVWTDKIDHDVFESEWESIMNDFSLNDNKWLNDMFEMRTNWIPAYFRHEPMSGLMRTTSRSESENHVLGQITNPYLSLVEFRSHYDTAIDSQRYIYGKNTHNSNYKTPDLKTHLVIEKEAADCYTHTIFYDVQDEIFSSLMHCCSLSLQESDSCSTFVIRDTEADYRIKGSWVQAKYEVTYVPDPCSAKCTCLRYKCFEIYSNIEESPHHLVGDIQKLHIYGDDQTALMEKAKLDVPNPPKLNTNEAYTRTLSVTEPAELTIFTPTCINNKGQVIRTRRKSRSKIAIVLGD
ncbi:zinc finger, SWIM-type, MULE transposase domain, FHY3/FAR1 family [Artemisia annua]|uniref:Zinc finger, SWIM-type, MULE transposase domain, FHY3/FAR1 family n=1 Tax=Artemisia annua TaxID=35608 RepID=A0A2U1MP12_ARTAN|nr:zinc finger, SWIM-type, MULE transposase domain, FHY3/FAR1 family [Artemisia annua]